MKDAELTIPRICYIITGIFFGSSKIYTNIAMIKASDWTARMWLLGRLYIGSTRSPRGHLARRLGCNR